MWRKTQFVLEVIKSEYRRRTNYVQNDLFHIIKHECVICMCRVYVRIRMLCVCYANVQFSLFTCAFFCECACASAGAVA